MSERGSRLVLLLGVPLVFLGGCAERRIRVTSEPSGARVWLNDEEIGRTPTEARFTFYGSYDLRLEHPGFEPYHAEHIASAPLHEFPGPDLAAAAYPGRISHTVEWHIDLERTPETTMEPNEARRQLIDRAASLRERSRIDAER
ncbi:MAG: PEGA domain-containing protein [Planctomycetota bacterium]